MMFAGKHVDFSGGGAMGGLCMGIVANKLWSSGWAPGGRAGRLSLGKDEHFAHEVEDDLAVAWTSIFQPLLFGVIGSAIKFANLSAATIPRSIMLVLIGLCVRLPAAFTACSFGALNFKEKLFIALSWVPKATVQAALASDPLETIMESKSNEPDFDKWEQWGNEILTTAVFSIILTAPLGMMIINVLGPRWLSQDVDAVSKTAKALAMVYDVDEDFKDLHNLNDDAPENGAAATRNLFGDEPAPISLGVEDSRGPGRFSTGGARRSRSSSTGLSLPRSSTNWRTATFVPRTSAYGKPSRRSLEGRPVEGSLPPMILDAAAKLELLATSLQFQIEELPQSENTAQMLGALTAINQLGQSQLASTVRPVVKTATFDVPGQFFRKQREATMLLGASENVLARSSVAYPSRSTGGGGMYNTVSGVGGHDEV